MRRNREPLYRVLLIGALVFILLALYSRYVSWPLFVEQAQMESRK